MQERTDPLIPLLGAAVTAVVLLAIGVIFYPRISRLFGPDHESVARLAPEPGDTVEVWVSRSAPGVALLLERRFDEKHAGTLDKTVQRKGPAGAYLQLRVYNFARDAAFHVDLAQTKFAAPDGGPVPVAVADLLPAKLEPRHQAVLRALGAERQISVARGRHGQLLLFLPGGGAQRGGFALGDLMFERLEVERRTLAAFVARPTLADLRKF